MRDFFENLTENLTGCNIFLDIDGTLLPDGKQDVDAKVYGKTRELAGRNAVFLCTNGSQLARTQAIGAALGLLVIHMKKPWKGAIEIYLNGNHPPVVIGDKFLTDGLLAKNIGARFMKVARRESADDRFFIKAVNFFDDWLYYILVEKLGIIKFKV